jgi:hypothetical protein
VGGVSPELGAARRRAERGIGRGSAGLLRLYSYSCRGGQRKMLSRDLDGWSFGRAASACRTGTTLDPHAWTTDQLCLRPGLTTPTCLPCTACYGR